MRSGLSRMSLRSSGLHRSTWRFFACARNNPGATVARMSAAICGAAFPGYRCAHPGYTAQHGGLLRWHSQRPRRNRSPHERSDMRVSLSRMSLRSSGLHRLTWRFFAGARNAPGATVARMSAAICGVGLSRISPPLIRATPLNMALLRLRPQRPRRNRSPHERSDMRGSFPDIARSSGLHRSTRRASSLAPQRPRRNRSPHERSDMRGSPSRMSLRSSGLHRSTRRALRSRPQRPTVTRPRRICGVVRSSKSGTTAAAGPAPRCMLPLSIFAMAEARHFGRSLTLATQARTSDITSGSTSLTSCTVMPALMRGSYSKLRMY